MWVEADAKSRGGLNARPASEQAGAAPTSLSRLTYDRATRDKRQGKNSGRGWSRLRRPHQRQQAAIEVTMGCSAGSASA